jgi:hypothetical protein
MKSFKLVMDIFPSTFSPIGIQDYCARQIFPLIHESLLKKSNNKIICNYFVDSFDINENIITFSFNNSGRWNTGDTITPKNYLLSANLMSNTNSDFDECFKFIKKDKFDNFKISTKQNKLIIELAFVPPNIEEYFSSSVWVPVCDQLNNDYTNFSGKYFVDEISTNYFVLKSNYGHPELRFEIIKDIYSPLKLYLNREVNFTCPTYFPFDKINYFLDNDDFSQEASDIQFILDVNYERLPEFKSSEIKKRLLASIDTSIIERELHNGCISWGFFSCINHSSHLIGKQSKKIINLKSNYSNKVILNTIEISYSDYYPNEEIVNLVSQQLIEANICNSVIKKRLSFENLYSTLNSGDYQLSLLLELPSVKSTYYIYSSLSKYISEHSISEYKNLLRSINSFSDESFKNEVYQKLESILQNELPYIPILNGKHLYLKDRNLDFLHLDDDGRLLLK